MLILPSYAGAAVAATSAVSAAAASDSGPDMQQLATTEAAHATKEPSTDGVPAAQQASKAAVTAAKHAEHSRAPISNLPARELQGLAIEPQQVVASAAPATQQEESSAGQANAVDPEAAPDTGNKLPDTMHNSSTSDHSSALGTSNGIAGQLSSACTAGQQSKAPSAFESNGLAPAVVESVAQPTVPSAAALPSVSNGSVHTASALPAAPAVLAAAEAVPSLEPLQQPATLAQATTVAVLSSPSGAVLNSLGIAAPAAAAGKVVSQDQAGEGPAQGISTTPAATLASAAAETQPIANHTQHDDQPKGVLAAGSDAKGAQEAQAAAGMPQGTAAAAAASPAKLHGNAPEPLAKATAVQVRTSSSQSLYCNAVLTLQMPSSA